MAKKSRIRPETCLLMRFSREEIKMSVPFAVLILIKACLIFFLKILPTLP
jgi:hypothetical protein